MSSDITADPYNWPFPKRNNLMSLQTISIHNNQLEQLINEENYNQQDVGFPKYQIKEERKRNFDLSDIRGASPEMRGYKFNQKETFVNKNVDIEGSQPKSLIKHLNKTDFGLLLSDIKGAQPQINKFQTTRQPFNPLNPQYVLPTAQVRVSTPPKFVRDSININDIDGTKPNPKFFKTRNIDIYTEIEGSKPKNLFIPRDHIDILNVKDINEFLQFKTTRHTNPLYPRYITQDEEGKKIDYGEIIGSASRRLHPVESQKINFNLTTKDVSGAWHGTHTEKFLRRDTRKDFRATNTTIDLPEAQVGSLKKGIVTVRQSNPLNPQYELLGQSEGLKNYDSFTNPVKEQAITRASTSQGFKQSNTSENEQKKMSTTTANFGGHSTTQNFPKSNKPVLSAHSMPNNIQNAQKPPTPNTQQAQLPKVQTNEGTSHDARPPSKGTSGNPYNISSHVGYPLSVAQKFDKFIS